jgi:hypothetical protein
MKPFETRGLTSADGNQNALAYFRISPGILPLVRDRGHIRGGRDDRRILRIRRRPVGAGRTWHSLSSQSITAYRKIVDLRLVYRESYDSHGFNLEPDRMRT